MVTKKKSTGVKGAKSRATPVNRANLRTVQSTTHKEPGLMKRLAAGAVVCAEGYVFELERRGYLQAGAFVTLWGVNAGVALAMDEVCRELPAMLEKGIRVGVAAATAKAKKPAATKPTYASARRSGRPVGKPNRRWA